MASGETLFQSLGALHSSPPNTVAAQIDWIVGTSAPVELMPVLAFDAGATVEYADFYLDMPLNYSDATGITITTRTGATTTTGGIVWEFAIRRINDNAEDVDTTAHTYVYTTLAITTLATTVGMVRYNSIAITKGANMDNLVAGEKFILRVRRATGHASDTATGDAFLHGLQIKET